MVTFSQELLCEVVQEAQPLLERHYLELAKNQDKVALNPDWERYAALELGGDYVIYTARKDGGLIGYAGFFCAQHPHYMDLLVVNNDVLFLDAEHRVGRTGIRFIQFCENEIAKRYGTGYCLAWHAKENTVLSGVLGRMGYGVQDIIFTKLC